MKTYTLSIHKDGEYTYIRVPELDHGTQARNIGEIESMGRDLIATLLDIEPDTFKVVINDPENIIREPLPVESLALPSTRKTYDFTATDWFHIDGRGWVATVEKDAMQMLQADGLWEPNQIVNSVQNISGHPYRVTGIDAFAIYRAPDSPYNFGFGMLVRGPRVIHNSEPAGEQSMNHRTVYIIQERGLEYTARGVHTTEEAAEEAAADLGLQAGEYEIQETEFHE